MGEACYSAYDNPSASFLGTSLYTREAFLWFLPWNLVLSFSFVGDDILGVPKAFTAGEGLD